LIALIERNCAFDEVEVRGSHRRGFKKFALDGTFTSSYWIVCRTSDCGRGPSDGPHLSKIGTTICGAGKRPGAKVLMQVVLEQAGYDWPLSSRRSQSRGVSTFRGISSLLCHAAFLTVNRIHLTEICARGEGS
jgi:hypothetical protein